MLHNDVATRNALLSEKGVGSYALLCDFGISRFLRGGGVEQAHLIDPQNDEERWPIRQMPCESLAHPYRLSTESDSWMFGMFMYEVRVE